MTLPGNVFSSYNSTETSVPFPQISTYMLNLNRVQNYKKFSLEIIMYVHEEAPPRSHAMKNCFI